MSEPTIEDGIEYHICEECGHCVTREYSAERGDPVALIERFQREMNLSLPQAYVDFVLAGKHQELDPQLIKVDGEITPKLQYYLDSGYVSVSQIFGTDLDGVNTIYCTRSMSKEWDLPEGLVLLCGDGHTWIALDYRGSKSEPSVIFLETDSYGCIELASSFESFLEALIPYESVYDEDGELLELPNVTV